MSESTEATSGANDPTSGEVDNTHVPSPTVSREAYEKLLREKRNEAKGRKELEERVAAQESAALADQQRWKEIAEKREVELKTLKEEREQRLARDQRRSKFDAVKKQLSPLGLRADQDELLERLLDVDDLIVEGDEVIGAEEKAKAFHQKYADLGIFQKAKPKVPHDAPNAANRPTRMTAGSRKEKKAALREELARMQAAKG